MFTRKLMAVARGVISYRTADKNLSLVNVGLTATTRNTNQSIIRSLDIDNVNVSSSCHPTTVDYKYHSTKAPFTSEIHHRHVKEPAKKVETNCLNEGDLEEKFIRGSGPGGQKVNKTSNCVELRHKITGIVVQVYLYILFINKKD